MKTIILIFFEFISTAVFSQITTIDILKRLEKKGKISLSEIADQISYVKLETTKDCLIGRTNKLYFYKDNWFIRQGRILRFDQNGKFLNQISGRGKGPSEFIDLSGVGFNAKNDHLYLINRLTDKAMEFSLDGSFICDINNNKGFLTVPFHDDCFVNYFPIRALFLSDGYRITVVSLDGKIQKELLKQDVSKINGNLSIQNSNLCFYKDSVTCWEGISDTIYRISRDSKITPRYILNLGKETTPFYLKVPNSSPEFRRESDKYSFVLSFVESDRFLFFEVSRKGVPCFMVYNKTNGNSFCIEASLYAITNDLDQGCNFWPLGATDDGRLYSIAQVSDLKELYGGSPSNSIPSTKTDKSLKSIVENSKEDDNPILILITPKN